MRPAFSVVIFTTLTGAGQGLFLAVYIPEVMVVLRGGAPNATAFPAVGAALAAGLAILGLTASFFHLGHPEKAWRAATMWRTSWLSREVIALPAFIACCLAYALAGYFGAPGALWIGAAGLLACAALFVCTAMIYMCLKFLQEWASPLTLLNFVLLGAASGCTLSVPLAQWLAPPLSGVLAAVAMVLTLAALASRLASLARNARLKPTSTLQSAIGIANPRIRQVSQGFTGRSFNMREFLHGASPRKMRAVKWAFLWLTFVFPALFLAAGVLAKITFLLLLAFPVQYLGLLAERWYFFAQARHPQNIYYQAIA